MSDSEKPAHPVALEDLAAMAPSGARLGVGGVHLSRLPLALIRKVIDSGKKDFIFISWGGGLPLELFLEAKAVRRLIFCFSSLDFYGLAPRFREALETGTIEVEEWTALAMMQALHAAHFRLPEMPFQLPVGSDMMQRGDFWKAVPATFAEEQIGQARRLDLDVLLLHAQRADRAGNIEIQGARGLDLSMLGAARKVLVSVEEIVETGVLGSAPRSFVLPRAFVTAIAHAPWGAWPSSCVPYYATDYRELLHYVREEQRRRRKSRSAVPVASVAPDENLRSTADSVLPAAPEKERKEFLVAAARVNASDFSPEVIDRTRYHAASDKYTVDELMVSCLSREYDNQSICSVGSVSPLAMVSYLLAKRTHSPNLTIIALNGGYIDIDFHPMTVTASEPLEFESAKVVWGGDETYHWYYQQGRITHEVITVAQVDKHGRTNNAWIAQGEKRLRLPGQGGMADVANLHRNFILYLTRHSPERFVDHVDFCSASRGLLTAAERAKAGLPHGVVRLITDLGVFQLDEDERVFRLLSLHPGVTLDEVRQRSGGDFLVSDPLQETEPPSAGELLLIREEIDPFAIRRLEFVPGKDRLNLIESILSAETVVVEHARNRAGKTGNPSAGSPAPGGKS